MQRARLIVPLILLAFGLHSCRRTSWKIVAEPAPVHPLAEQPADLAPGEGGALEESSPVSTMTSEVNLLGRTARASDAGVLEGHVVGAAQAQALPARGER